MSWRVVCLIALFSFFLGAQSVTLASGEYAGVQAAALLAALVFLTLSYLWWRLLGAVMRTLLKLLVVLVVVTAAFGVVHFYG